MHSSKGYIVPIVLILILLIVAGFFIFTQKPVESPTLDTLPVLVATTTPSTSDLNTDDKNNLEEDTIATTTATTTVSSSNECRVDSDCLGRGICYFEPGGKVGVCTGN